MYFSNCVLYKNIFCNNNIPLDKYLLNFLGRLTPKMCQAAKSSSTLSFYYLTLQRMEFFWVCPHKTHLILPL